MTNSELLENLCISEISFVNTYIAKNTDYPMKNKGRYHGGLLYTVKGTEIYSFNEKTIHACPDSVLVIPSNEAYRIDLDDKQSIVTVIDFELSDEAEFRPFCIKLGENNSIKNLFESAKSLWNSTSKSRIPQLKAVFYQIITQLINHENTYTYSGNFKKIEKAVEHLHSHLTEHELCVEGLAEISGMSKRYFEKLFSAEFGMSPRDYIISKKTELAKELLQSEKYSVTDVAISLGYSDIYQFSKMFKLKTGCNPSEYKHQSL